MASLFDLPFEDDDAADLMAGDGGAAVSGKPTEPREAKPEPDMAPSMSAVRAPRPSPVRRVLTVSELTVRLRDTLESQFGELWVEGELSNCKNANAGHLYFTLKDGSAQIRGFMFRSAVRYLKFRPADGLRVVARGKISVYEPRGEYQLVCEHLEPHGLGALQLAYDQLRKRLEAEGLFETARKRPLPALPRKIGVVTSLEGAAIRDIIKVLRRRHASVQILVRPARVQGEGAALDLARAIKAIGRVPGVEVLIVGRGGGSIEDLWAFNEEIVARAIAMSPVPVVSAVGHETDYTIADFVADLRAPTPSAAAEMVVAAKDEFSARIDRLRQRLHGAAGVRLDRWHRRLNALEGRPAIAGFPGRIAMRARHASELSYALLRLARDRVMLRDRQVRDLSRQLGTYDLGRRLQEIRTRLVGADGHLAREIAGRHHRADSALRESASRLEALSPLAVLARGYAVCWNADRTRVIRETSQTEVGEEVRVTLGKGELRCEVRDRTASPKDTN